MCWEYFFIFIFFSICIGFIWWMHDCPPVVVSCIWQCHWFCLHVEAFSCFILWLFFPFSLVVQGKKKKKKLLLWLYCFSPWSVNPAQNFSLGFSIWTPQLTCLLVLSYLYFLNFLWICLFELVILYFVHWFFVLALTALLTSIIGCSCSL